MHISTVTSESTQDQENEARKGTEVEISAPHPRRARYFGKCIIVRVASKNLLLGIQLNSKKREEEAKKIQNLFE